MKIAFFALFESLKNLNAKSMGIAIVVLAGLSGTLSTWALPRFKFSSSILDNVSRQATQSKVLAAVKNQVNSMTNQEILTEALHGRLGACTYSRIPEGSPLSPYFWGVISTGQHGTPIKLAGPIVSGAPNIPSSGLIPKTSAIKTLMRPGLTDVYGGAAVLNEADQVAAALKVQIDLPGDVCKLVQYSQKLANEANRARNLAGDFQNIVFSKSGDKVNPNKCALRENVVPVSNLGDFLDGPSNSSGCAYSLRPLPGRQCLSIYAKNLSNITGYHALSSSKFENSLGLRNKLKGINPILLAALTTSFVSRLGIKFVADLNLDDLTPISVPGANTTSTQKNTDFAALDPSVKDMLKLYHTFKALSVDGASLSSVFPNNSRVVQLSNAYSDQISGYSGSGGIQPLLTNDLLATQNLPTSPAFDAHTFPVDMMSELGSITYASGTTMSPKRPDGTALTVVSVNSCITMNVSAAALPRSIGRIDDTLAPVPVNPTSNTSWVTSSATMSFSSGNSNNSNY